MRPDFKWTTKQLDKLNKVIDILDDLEAYKPLTLRQVYYQLVGKGYIDNKTSEYVMLSKLLKFARLDGHISWLDIEDRVRAYHDLTGWEKSGTYIEASFKHFLKGYQRDLMQSQEVYIEIWIEKDALSSIFTRVAEKYTIPVVVCRGFTSISFLYEYQQRLESNPDKIPIMLYFGDFDPSGLEMLESMKITLETEMFLNTEIIYKRVALMKSDIKKYKLPNDPQALKKTDTRAKKFLQKYGSYAVELDALRPDILENKIKKAIENEIDIELFYQELDAEKLELEEIRALKVDLLKYIARKRKKEKET